MKKRDFPAEKSWGYGGRANQKKKCFFCRMAVWLVGQRACSQEHAGDDLGVGEADVVDVEVEGLGGVEGVIGEGGGDFHEAVGFVDGAVAQGDADFLAEKGDAPGGADFFEDGVFGWGGCGGRGECGGCGGVGRRWGVGVVVDEEEFLLGGHDVGSEWRVDWWMIGLIGLIGRIGLIRQIRLIWWGGLGGWVLVGGWGWS